MSRQHPGRGVAPASWRPTVLTILLGVLLVSPGKASGVEVSGYLEYTGRHARSEAGRVLSKSDSHIGTLRLDGRTALWEPWLAHLRAGVGLSITQTEFRPAGEPSRESTGHLRTGDLELHVLPASRVPLHLWAERRDSRLSDEGELLDVLGVDRSMTRYGLLQQYNARSGARYRFRIEETQLKEISGAERNDERLEVDFNASKSWTENDFSLDLRQDRTRQEESERLTDRRTLAARHRYAPRGSNTTVNNLASRVERDTRTPVASSGFTQGQFASTTFWRSAGPQPLYATGSLRLVDTRSEFGEQNSDDTMADLSLGASYRPTLYWRLDATSGLNWRETPGGDELSHRHTLTADYTSARRPFLGMEHRWDAVLRLGHRGSDAIEDASDATASLGQTLERQLAQGPLGHVHLTLQESFAHTWSTVDDPRLDMLHGISVYWNHGAGETTAFGQFQATDVRQFRDGEREQVFQLLNLQFSMQQQIDRRQSLSGSANFQTSRSGDADGMGPWQPSTSIGLIYAHQQLFGVPRLRLRSDLRYMSDDVLRLLQREDSLLERETIRWENRVDYSIGLLDVRLLVTLSEHHNSQHQLYLLNVRRRFGY